MTRRGSTEEDGQDGQSEPDERRPVPPSPVPDDKDWTWTLDRPCPECGFDSAMIEPVAIPALVRDAVSRWPDVLSRPDVAVRPTPTTWSPLEYACHVRDVCLLFAQRLQLMLDSASGVPATFANWDQDETALQERYWEQDPQVVDEQLAAAGEDLAVAYTRVGDDDWGRTGLRSNGSEFNVETLGRYLLHDLFHHVWDVHG